MNIPTSINVELNIPSGKIVIDDSLIDLVKDSRESAFIPYRVKARNRMQKLANQGVIFGYMGNSTPGFYKDGDSIIIGSNPVDANYEEIQTIPGKKLTHLMTDCSSYGLMDYDRFHALGGDLFPSTHEHQNPDVVDVTPGRYVVNHFYGISEPDTNYELYAKLRLSNSPVENGLFPEEVLTENIEKLFSDTERILIDQHSPKVYSLSMRFPEIGLPITIAVPERKVEDKKYLLAEVNNERAKWNSYKSS